MTQIRRNQKSGVADQKAVRRIFRCSCDFDTNRGSRTRSNHTFIPPISAETASSSLWGKGQSVDEPDCFIGCYGLQLICVYGTAMKRPEQLRAVLRQRGL